MAEHWLGSALQLRALHQQVWKDCNQLRRIQEEQKLLGDWMEKSQTEKTRVKVPLFFVVFFILVSVGKVLLVGWVSSLFKQETCIVQGKKPNPDIFWINKHNRWGRREVRGQQTGRMWNTKSHCCPMPPGRQHRDPALAAQEWEQSWPNLNEYRVCRSADKHHA